MINWITKPSSALILEPSIYRYIKCFHFFYYYLSTCIRLYLLLITFLLYNKYTRFAIYMSIYTPTTSIMSLLPVNDHYVITSYSIGMRQFVNYQFMFNYNHFKLPYNSHVHHCQYVTLGTMICNGLHI